MTHQSRHNDNSSESNNALAANVDDESSTDRNNIHTAFFNTST